MKRILIATLLLSNLSSFSQKKGDTTYTYVGNDILGQDAPEGQQQNSFFMGTSFEYAVNEFTNVLAAGVRNKKEQQRIENARQQSIAKLGIIKSQYAGYAKYPEKMTDGWHNVMATDNGNFCKDAKVLVKDNKIKKFVIDNYIPINFLTTGGIKNAKAVITLKNFNGEQLNILELYFIYDIEEQTLTEEPLKAGYICFWTDLNHYPDIQLKLDNVLVEKFTTSFDNEPNCFEKGMICRILKPGTYSFKAAGKGAIDWDGNFEIKSGECLKYKLTSKWH